MELFEFPRITGWLTKYTAEIILVCLSFKALFIAIAFVYNMAVTLFKSKGMKPIDVSKISRVVVLAFCLVWYIPLAVTTSSLMGIMYEYSKPKLSKTQIMTAYIKEQGDQAKQKVIEENGEPDLSTMEWIQAEWATLKATIKTFLLTQVTGVMGSDLLLLTIRGIVAALTNVLIKVFYVLGPFAILFSILPGFESKFYSWLSTWITMLFIPTVYNILEGINIAHFAEVIEKTGLENIMTHNIINTTMIILYLLPFWIAGKVVGNADAGRFLSQTGQLATMAMGKGVTSVLSKMGSVAGANSGSNNVDNISDASRDAMSVK